MALSPEAVLGNWGGGRKEVSFHDNAGAGAESKWNKHASSQGRKGEWKLEMEGEGQWQILKS